MRTLTFIGNATTLLRWGPFTVLSDPNFLHRGQRAYLGHGLWSRRLTEPALGLGDLPDLDLVLLSHLHGDHWDRVTRRGLDRQTPIVTTPHAARRLQGLHQFRRAIGLRPAEQCELVKDGCTLTVTAVPGKHAPTGVGWALPPVMGSILDLTDESGARHRLYYSGDTLMCDRIHEVARLFRDVDVAIVHLGGTKLAGVMTATMDAAQGRRFVEVVRPKRVVPVHHSDYTVFRSPLSDFVDEISSCGLGGSLELLEPGQSIGLSTQPHTDHSHGAHPGRRHVSL